MLGLADYVRQTTVHSLVVLLLGEALLCVWALNRPRLRYEMRLLAFFLPPVAYLGFSVLAPERWRDHFAADVVLLDTRPWLTGSTGVPALLSAAWIALVLVTVGLYLLQLWLFVRQRQASREGQPARPGDWPRLDAALAQLRLGSKPRAPAIHVIDAQAPVLYALGGARPGIAVSSGLMAALDRQELAAALAHEDAHGRPEAKWMRWLAWCGRTVMLYNPVAVVALRQALHEVEALCDESAGRETGHPLACASALIKVWQLANARSGCASWAGWRQALIARTEALQEQGEQATVEDRVERLLRGPGNEKEAEWQWLRLAATTIASLGLMYLIL